jgi:IS30 family transposase
MGQRNISANLSLGGVRHETRTSGDYHRHATRGALARYKVGETILKIGRALGQRPSDIHRVLQASGGIAPAQRHRASKVLSFRECEEISRGIAAGSTFRAIARSLKRAVSTVSQEVARHGGRGCYRAAQADWAAWESARRPKICLLARNRDLQRIVAVKLKQDWSPQQIAGWVRDQYPQNPELWVSHETIYRSLFVQARGALKRELIGHLRSKRRIRRSCHATDRGIGRGEITDAISIRQRPAEAEDRAVPGHWEGDLVEGSRGTYIATLVERRSRFLSFSSNSPKRAQRLSWTLSSKLCAGSLQPYENR